MLKLALFMSATYLKINGRYNLKQLFPHMQLNFLPQFYCYVIILTIKLQRVNALIRDCVGVAGIYLKVYWTMLSSFD
jgi:hypothetical protein